MTQRLLLIALVALILISAGCSESSGYNGAASTPPLPTDGDYDCSDFSYQEQAQKVWAYNKPGDKYNLDNDSDGTPCENLPENPPDEG